jgi:hypothetical protein
MSSSPPPVGDDTPPLRSRALTIIVVALVAALVVSGLLWLLGGRDSTSGEGGAIAPQPTTAPSASATSPGATPTGPGKTRGTGTATSPATGATKPAGTPRKTQRIPFQETGQPAADVDLRIAQVETITAKGHIPGEVSGPALRITVEVENRSQKSVPLNTAVANFYYGKDRTPASPMIMSGSRAFPAKVAAGSSASGVYVFTVPKAERGRILLEVNLDNALRTVEFNGGCPEDC